MNSFSTFLENCKIIDLTHPLNKSIPTWDGLQGFDLNENDEMKLYTSSGTHIDAPRYFNEKGWTIDSIPVKQLIAPAHLIDLSKTATERTVIRPKDIEKYEAEHGAILPNSLVIAYTGWSKHWSNMQKYRNVDSEGVIRAPTWGIPALELLLRKEIAGVAIDALALESLDSSYPGHKLLLGANKYIIENIANCHLLPAKGATVIALPLKIENGNEAPARVIAFVPVKGSSIV